MEKAFLITKNHFNIEEVNYNQLKNFTNNIILEYIDDSNDELFYFKRSLFELDRLNYNIGILVNTDNISDINQFIKNLMYNHRGFKINLGIWIKGDHDLIVYNILRTEFKYNFIVGLVSDININNIPRWCKNGDIEENTSIILDFIKEPIMELYLNTDYKTIYDENKLSPIPSTYK